MLVILLAYVMAAAGVDLDRFLTGHDPVRIVAMNAAEKAQAVAQVERVKEHAAGKTLQEACFVLASLGHKYEENRNCLRSALRSCGVAGSDCDEDTAELVIGLYAQGHRELLRDLMRLQKRSDGALSELLFDFYGTELARSPAIFVATLSHLPRVTRVAVCNAAAWGDGSGARPGTVPRAQRGLRRIGSPVALQCLRDLSEGDRECQANISGQ